LMIIVSTSDTTLSARAQSSSESLAENTAILRIVSSPGRGPMPRSILEIKVGHPNRLGKPAQAYPALLAPLAHVLPERHVRKS
jgi:hypothetical protein